jgi:phosphatidylserine decarboxylase
MAKSLQEWITDDVEEHQSRTIDWLSQYHFFRDPPRPAFSDLSYFFSPADGVIVYQHVVKPDEPLVQIKGRPYSLQEAMRDDSYSAPSLVVGIFMTFYDVHVNRIPYPGRVSYQVLDPLDTYNHPMLDVEKGLLERLHIDMAGAEYLRHNQRMLNRIDSPQLEQPYYLLQIADYDVDCITPFDLRQHRPRMQGERFSQIRFGSQVDLIIPLSERHDFEPLQQVGTHVEAGLDPVVAVRPRSNPNPQQEL